MGLVVVLGLFLLLLYRMSAGLRRGSAFPGSRGSTAVLAVQTPAFAASANLLPLTDHRRPTGHGAPACWGWE